MSALLSTLPESGRARARRSPAGVALSVAVHAALITGAIVATLHGEPRAPQSPEPEPDFVWFDRPPAPPGERRGGGRPSEPGVPRPVERPVVLPSPDLPPLPELGLPPVNSPSTPIDDARQLGRDRSGGGGGVGSRDGAGPAAGGGPYTFAQVEEPAAMLPGSSSPHYPAPLREARVEGRVVVHFVVDTTGRAEPATLRVVSSTHELFTAAVRAALPSLRFSPARAGGGRLVRQLVELPFEFTLGR